MKIRAKLIGGFFIVVAMGITLGVVGFYSIRQISASAAYIRSRTGIKSNISSILGSHYVWRHGLTEKVYAGKEFTGSLDSTACSLGKWLSGDVKEVRDPEVLEYIKQIVEPHRTIHNKAGDIIRYLDNGETDAALRMFREDVSPTALEVFTKKKKMDARYDGILDENTQNIYDLGARSERIIIIVIIVALILGVVLALTITSAIVKPIVKVAGVLKIVADGDLTQNTNVSTKDEVGDLLHDFNFMVEKIRSLVGTIKYRINGLNHTSFELSVNMGNTSTAVRQISSNLDNMKNLMVKQENGAVEAGKAVEDIKGNIDSLKKMIEEQTESVNMSSSAIEEMT
ncbi:MAG: CZB domain-containing protein, partial [Treponema sp.]|nr:CZB domain-containing protein [Treponema sp.]